MKACSKCKAVKAYDGFYVVKGKPGSWCKTCTNASSKASYQNNRAARNQRISTIGRAHRLGLTYDEYVALPCDPGTACNACGCAPDSPRNGAFNNGAGPSRPKRLAVDHDHQTGAIRGFLCGHCNRALGLMADSPELLRKLADYIEVGGLGWEPLARQRPGRKPDPNRVVTKGDSRKATRGRKSTLACSVPDCPAPHYGRGYCRNHWYRWSTSGDPLGGRPYTRRTPA